MAIKHPRRSAAYLARTPNGGGR